MDSAGNIFIDRGNLAASFSSYDQAAALIRAGMSAMVFAEGTRSLDGRLLPFKKGPFVLAIHAGVPLVPVYIYGAFERTPKGGYTSVPARWSSGLATDPHPGLIYEDRARLGDEARAAMWRWPRVDGVAGRQVACWRSRGAGGQNGRHSLIALHPEIHVDHHRSPRP